MHMHSAVCVILPLSLYIGTAIEVHTGCGGLSSPPPPISVAYCEGV